jgi:hypothetical protein
MADTKFSALPSASSLADADIVPTVQGGTPKKLTALQIAAYISAYTNGSALAGRKLWTQTSDPGGSATDGDIWFAI